MAFSFGGVVPPPPSTAAPTTTTANLATAAAAASARGGKAIGGGVAAATGAAATGAAPHPSRPAPATTASASAMIIDVPNRDATFPGIKMRSIVASSLARWRSATATGGDANFASDELTRLLRAIDDPVNSVGRDLVDPMSSLPPLPQFLLPTSANRANDREDEDERNIKERLRSLASSTDDEGMMLLDIAASTSSSSSFANNNTATTATASSSPSLLMIRRNGIDGTLTAISPDVARGIIRLVDELGLTVKMATSLYVESYSSSYDGKSRNNNTMDHSGGDGRVGRHEDDDDDDDDDDDGMTGYGNRVRTLIDVGSAGRRRIDRCDDIEYDVASTGRGVGGGGWERGHDERVHRTAMRLHYRESSSIMMTIVDLVRHRVEAYDGVVSSSSSSNNGGRRKEENDKRNALLVATDQLLAAGLVCNLVEFVRETTRLIGETRGGVDRIEKERMVEGGRGGTRREGGGGIGGGGVAGGGTGGGTSPWWTSAPPSTTAVATPPSRLGADRRDGDKVGHNDGASRAMRAILGFYITQRQIASETLFFLTYHTQLEVSEVVSLIDLIQELMNGGTASDDGLAMLEPWSDDVVPSPGAEEWEDDLVSSMWRSGRPQLLQCVSSLIMSIVCAFDVRHVLVNRNIHGPNDFGIGNALLPPPGGGRVTTSTISELIPIHTRLDPDVESAVEEGWRRRDVWGLLLVPYALLLRDHQNSAGPPSPSLRGGGVIDVRGTYTQCLTVASQLKSLTFARLTLLPALSSSLLDRVGGGHCSPSSSSIYDFYLSALSEFTAQYVDALGTSGNFPITRREWLDEEMNSAQSEWMEKEQARQFGEWAGRTSDDVNDDEDDPPGGGPRAANVIDRPDCLEDVFALVSSVCEAHPAGIGAFWYVVEEQREDEGGLADIVPSAILAPSRALQTLDLRQSDNDSSLSVYLTFLASLALADSVDGGLTTGGDGAAMVHSYLSGNRAINPRSTDRRIHFLWTTIISSIRWYAENLSPSDDGGVVTATEGTNKSAKIRLSSNSVMDESSSSYYYGVGGGGVASGGSSNNADGNASSPLSERSSRGSPSTAGISTTMELDEIGHNTLMALLSLVANVASKCHAARVFVLGIELPASDSTDSSGVVGYHDGSLEILFSLLTITSLPPEIMGATFVAIANLLQPNEDRSGAALAASMPFSRESDASATVQHDVSIAGARRAWELMEMCQFVPIKFLSQYSSYAAGARSMPVSSLPNFTTQESIQSSSMANDLPSNIFPKSTDYGMIYQFEHVEAKLGKYPATEGFLFLLSTLVKVVGCPSTLGSQWRLRLGCAPYIEYVTDFVLPRSVGVDKNVQPLYFATVSDECRLVERALEVIEAVIVRYVVPSSCTTAFNMDDGKDQYLASVKKAKEDMGLAAIASDVFLEPDNLDEEGISSAYADFRTAYLPPQEVTVLWNNTSRTNEMLEASFGNQVPLPKTPGFTILCNLLSSNRGVLFQIILKILSHNGGVKGIREYGDRMHSGSLAKSLFRETPPNLLCARDCAFAKSQAEQNIISGKACHKTLSTLQQTLIQSLNPLLFLSYYEKSCIASDDNRMNKSHGAMSHDALLWRERTLLLSLRILCAAAAREEAFIDALNKAGPPISVVPTLSFQGSIHGSFAHRFVHEEKVNVSRISQLLTKVSLAGHDGKYNSLEILPIITEFVGYNSCSLSNHQIIARCAFSIVSYIAHTLPHADCVHSLCGSRDMHGIRLADALSKGLSLHPLSETSPSAQFNIQDAILDLILSNINIDDSVSNNLNISIMMLGLNSDSKHNCIEVVLDLIADCDFVLNPRTSYTATKCFALIHRVYDLGTTQILSANVRRQQALFMEKLRRTKFWHTQVVRYLGMRGPSTQSIFHEISSSYSLEHGHDGKCSKRENDVLHSISYLLKGLAAELRFLMGQHNVSAPGGMASSSSTLNYELKSLLDCLSAQPNSLLLTMLIDMPLGQSSNERLHMIEAPSSEALKKSSKRLTDPVDACVGFEIIDIERLFCYFKCGGQSSSFEKAREWATTWNSFVGRVCAFSHISQAWSDVVLAALLCSPIVKHMDEPQTNYFMSTQAIIDILCTILSRLLNHAHLETLGHFCAYDHAEHMIAASIEAECAMPLSTAALGLVEVLIESISQVEKSAMCNAVSGFNIAEEDVARVCALIMGAISSCSENSAGMSSNDERAAVLSCALTRILLFSEDATYCIFAQNTFNMSNINANAVAHLFRLSTAVVYDDDERYGDAHQANSGAIACAARAGLISLLGHLKACEGVEAADELCSKVFTLDEVASGAAKLVRMITDEDNDASFLLRQMALFHDGVVLLAKAGVTTKLLEVAKKYLQSEHSFLASHLGSDGTARLKPPSLLKGQLSLLNGLLVSPLASSDRVALAVDSLQLVKIYSGIFERLTQQFPTDIDLTTTFVEALQITYTSLEEATGMNTFGRKVLDLDEPLSILERSVLRITCQLAAFPFPSRLLPPLPMGLINVEATYASQMKNITINMGNERSWWDNIPEIAMKVGQPLPVPPTGSFNISSQEKFSSYQYGADSTWSERNYEYAISSGRCLEMSISILISRVNCATQRGLSTFSVDAVAIAKGICRCSDASRAIHDRLGKLKTHPEEDVIKMLDASRVTNDWGGGGRPPLSRALKLERDCLLRLGTSLGRCAEKLVRLALLDAQRMATTRPPSASRPDCIQQWAYFIGALTPALDHTEMETKRVGCAFDDDARASMNTAQGLRREMEKLRSLMGP